MIHRGKYSPLRVLDDEEDPYDDLDVSEDDLPLPLPLPLVIQGCSILQMKQRFSIDICGDHPNAFWNRKKHVVSLPYEDSFVEDNIPTKARPCQMNRGLYGTLQKGKLTHFSEKGLIRHSKSPWSCH
ncbi:hypothetical protein H5410_064895 [Solanum commersonii]|uniref:Uncharacterized protein n=1 Tax=Solanum commersonii TaxID=4109 RepID=A0A9J5VY43_SOLCO|nr:hypothetical protein H5410_064895 [Solanum commersonii]